MTDRKIIITCAITGSIHTPSMSPYLPITPEEIAREAIAAAQAGAAIVHLHARDPETGMPSPDPQLFARFVPEIRDRTDAILSITTGGSARMTIEERLVAPISLAPEMCSLNMGTMNFALHPMAARKREWRHDWEMPFLAATRDGIFRNTFADMERIISELDGRFGTRFEFECYDIGHLYSLAYLRDIGVVKGPLFIQSVLGILGGIGADPESLIGFRATADRLFGRDYQWSVLPAGRAQMRLGTMAAIMGAHIRVGLEDNLWLGPDELARSNADQVTKLKRILAELSFTTATPAEARAMIGIPA